MNEKPLRVFLVEDDEDHTEIVLRSLSQSRVRTSVRTVADGEAALDVLLRRGEYRDECRYPRP